MCFAAWDLCGKISRGWIEADTYPIGTSRSIAQLQVKLSAAVASVKTRKTKMQDDFKKAMKMPDEFEKLAPLAKVCLFYGGAINIASHVSFVHGDQFVNKSKSNEWHH